MKPRPRICKTIKWVGAAVTVLLVAVWIGSGWGYFALKAPSGVSSRIHNGELDVLVRYSRPPQGSGLLPGGTGWVPPPTCGRTPFQLCSEFSWNEFFGGRYVLVPLWPAPMLSLLVTLVALRLEVLARGRARLDRCQNCNYDRAGITSEAKCPECGNQGTPA